MVTILMMLAKMTTLGLLTITAFQDKGYNAIIFVHDVKIKFCHVTQIIL